MTRLRRAGAVVVGTIAVLAGLSGANAANLPVASGSLSVSAAGHPCAGTASAVAANLQTGTNYRSVVVAPPAGCTGLPVQIRVDRPTGTDPDGVGTVDDSGVAAIRLSANYSTGVTNALYATVDGWALPISWSTTALPPIWCTVMDSATATCAATVTLFHGNKPGGGTFDYYDVEVTTTSTSYVRWEVGFKLDHAFYGTVPITLGNSTLDAFNDGQTSWTGTNANVTRVSQCGQYPGTLLVRGVNVGGGNSFEDVRADRLRQFSLVLDYQQGTYDDVVDANCS